jgi:hypothetical protein
MTERLSVRHRPAGIGGAIFIALAIAPFQSPSLPRHIKQALKLFMPAIAVGFGI